MTRSIAEFDARIVRIECGCESFMTLEGDLTFESYLNHYGYVGRDCRCELELPLLSGFVSSTDPQNTRYKVIVEIVEEGDGE